MGFFSTSALVLFAVVLVVALSQFFVLLGVAAIAQLFNEAGAQVVPSPECADSQAERPARARTKHGDAPRLAAA